MINILRNMFKGHTQQEMQVSHATHDVSFAVADRLRLILDRYVDETLAMLHIDPREHEINRHTQHTPLGMIETLFVDNTPTINIEVYYTYANADDSFTKEWEMKVRVDRLI